MSHDHFDDSATTYDDDPENRVRARQVADGIRAAIPLTGEERLLEYGAGTAMVSQAMAEHVGALTLADRSTGMRSVAAGKIHAGLLPAGTRIWDLDLTTDPAPDDRFDLVVSSLVLHHIRDLTPVLEGFHALLEPGGHLAIADLDTEDGSFHQHLDDFDGHDGFDRETLSRQLEGLGFEVVGVSDCATVDKHGGTFPVFLAVARRGQ